MTDNYRVSIGGIGLSGRLALAPMAGVSDIAFRAVCKKQGAALLYTEMISARALAQGDKKTRSLLRVAVGAAGDVFAAERPIGVQLFGSEPEIMAQAAKIALDEAGADFIDINMGCPVGKIVSAGDGCALMRDPEKAVDIISAVRRAVDVPVTAKIRKGWDGGSANAVAFAKMLEGAGVSAIAVHGRTRVQMYAGAADWDIIRDVKRAVSIPVLANGDVFEPEHAARILKYTGADLAMIGRGAFGNPWIFSRGNAAIEGVEIPILPPLRERMDTALFHTELSAAVKGEKIACLEARRHICWYLKGVAHAGYFKRLAVRLETLLQVRELIEGVKRELR